ncbi:MAG: M50 family metallopeptidase [Myxococcota bacterium]
MEPTELLLILAVHLCVGIVLHEAGHALGAVVKGLRVRAVGLGMPWRARRVSLLGVVLFVGRGSWRSATTWTEPVGLLARRDQLLWMLAGGPVVNLLCGFTMLGAPGAFWQLGAWAHLLLMVVNLLPWDLLGADGQPSDGQRLWAVWRRTEPALLEQSSSVAAEATALGMEQLGCVSMAARLWAMAAELRLGEGDLRGAARFARRGREAARGLPRGDGARLAAWCAALDVAVAGGHQEVARELWRGLRGEAGRDLAARARMMVAHARGELSRRPRAAERDARAAAELWRREGHATGLTEAQVALARVLAPTRPDEARAVLRQALRGPHTSEVGVRAAALAARLGLAEAQGQWERALRQLAARLRILRPVPRVMMLARVRELVLALSQETMWPARVDRDLEHVAMQDIRRGRRLVRPAVLGVVLGGLTVSLTLSRELQPWVAALACGLAGGLWAAVYLTRNLLRWPRRHRWVVK